MYLFLISHLNFMCTTHLNMSVWPVDSFALNENSCIVYLISDILIFQSEEIAIENCYWITINNWQIYNCGRSISTFYWERTVSNINSSNMIVEYRVRRATGRPECLPVGHHSSHVTSKSIDQIHAYHWVCMWCQSNADVRLFIGTTVRLHGWV